MKFLLRWLISAASVWVAARYVPGIVLEEGLVPLLAVSVIIGGVNALVRPILQFLACGLIFLTLGLFLLVINAFLLLMSSWIAQSLGIAFMVDGFWSAMIGSIIISVVSFLASTLLIGSGDEER